MPPSRNALVWSTLSLLAAVALLPACGGGGGGGGGSVQAPGGIGLSLRRDGGSTADAAYAVASYPDGSMVVTGAFTGTTQFGAGGPAQTSLQGLGGDDGFLARYGGPLGLSWVRHIAGSEHEVGNDVAVAPNGDCVVVGSFHGFAQFDNGNGSATTLTAMGQADENAFIARYNGAGMLLWARQIEGSDLQQASGVAVAPDGTVYVTGRMAGASTFGKFESNEKTIPSLGQEDMFLARYAANGNLMWATSAGGTQLDRARAVSIHPGGGCYVTGSFNGEAVFGFFEVNTTTLTSAGVSDVFVARYGDDGLLQWAKRAGGASYDRGNSITTLADGSAVTTGYIQGVAVFGANEPGQQVLVAGTQRGMYLARYAPNGSLAWARRATSTVGVQGHDVTVSPDGYLYVAGAINGTATFAPGEATQQLLSSSPGGWDGFVARYGSDGSFVWARGLGGPGADFAGGVAALGLGWVVVCGEFEGAGTFGAGSMNPSPLVSAGSTDIFLGRFAPHGELD